jgi:hypothetical protein
LSLKITNFSPKSSKYACLKKYKIWYIDICNDAEFGLAKDIVGIFSGISAGVDSPSYHLYKKVLTQTINIV